MNECIFCKIIKGEIPSYSVYQDEYCYAFLDIAKDVYGHTLVIPKKHVENLLDENCDAQTVAHVAQTAQMIAKHYVNNCGFDGADVMCANGASAEQSVFHLHFHVIPRKENDGEKMWNFTSGKDFDLAEMCQKLKVA